MSSLLGLDNNLHDELSGIEAKRINLFILSDKVFLGTANAI
jgi:hypothetical protein